MQSWEGTYITNSCRHHEQPPRLRTTETVQIESLLIESVQIKAIQKEIIQIEVVHIETIQSGSCWGRLSLSLGHPGAVLRSSVFILNLWGVVRACLGPFWGLLGLCWCLLCLASTSNAGITSKIDYVTACRFILVWCHDRSEQDKVLLDAMIVHTSYLGG